MLIFNSIRWRLQLWMAFLLVCLLGGFGLTAYQLQRNNRLGQLDEELARRVALINTDVRGGPLDRFRSKGPGRRGGGKGEPGREWNGPRLERPDGPGPQPLPPEFQDGRLLPPLDGPFGGGPGGPRTVELSPATTDLLNRSVASGYYYAVWSRPGTLLLSSTNAPAELAAPLFRADGRVQTRTLGVRREATQFTEMGDCILVGRFIAADLKELRTFAGYLVLAGLGVLVLGLGGGWWLATRAIRPIENISATAQRIAAGNLGERIRVAETDSELGRLAAVLNSSFARLEAAFAQQRQFTADASHELRTPIAVLISETQTALARQRSAAEYRETVEACLGTAQQMRRLAQSLLELARLDAGQETLAREPVDLAERAQDCVALLGALARERQVEIRCDLVPAPTTGDPVHLGQVITNLVTNAIQYNTHPGTVVVHTRRDHGSVLLSVADTGAGIAPEDLPHLFDRFYRSDKSRAAASGGTGLGLAICKAIVQAHGGSIVAESQPGQGSTFTVRLPAAPAAPPG